MKMIKASEGSNVPEALLDEVKTIIGGNIKESDDEFIGDLHYVSADG